MTNASMDLPVAIVDRRQSHLLEIEWEDGEVSRLAHAQLRARCRCATCEQQRRSGHPPKTQSEIELVGITPVADQGLNLAFSDGHARGIYPWAYLRELGDDGVTADATAQAA
ncbi:MAG TPA: DUF971 domain-containing protein [Rhodocyclaceae bacterium]|nr:DUF971 domain-containing protein [Rhodocyclaceae bacterium]